MAKSNELYNLICDVRAMCVSSVRDRLQESPMRIAFLLLALLAPIPAQTPESSNALRQILQQRQAAGINATSQPSGQANGTRLS
jgi:hypothetical protein